MSPSPSNPWPAPTPPPTPSSSKRRRIPSRHAFVPRQTIVDSGDIDSAIEECSNQNNDVISCFPTSDVVAPQHDYVFFVWNSNRPELTQSELVNIYLSRADSGQVVLSFPNHTNIPNGAFSGGSVSAPVNDSWFGDDATKWSGGNTTFPYVWSIERATPLVGEAPQTGTTFSAVQTTVADSVSSSLASASSASSASAASASAASASSASSASSVSSAHQSSASGSGSSASPSPTGNVQSDSGSDFPHWAIAVIVILGTLALVATGILIWLISRRVRNRNRLNSARGSMGSSSPMIPPVITTQAPHSPQMEQATLAGTSHPVSGGERPSSLVSPDGASTISHAHSAGDGPFSGADAAIMADAFRKALRKPDFAGPAIEEGESPDSQHREREAELLNRELAEEGRDIRSVSSSRGVRVETLSDGGDTVQDSPH